MELEQLAQEDLFARVATYLRQAFGELAEPLGEEPDFALELGRVHLIISVHAAGPEKASLHVYTWIAEGLLVTPEVALFLLHRNKETPFGTLGVSEESTIGFSHVLFGESVTKVTLSMLLRIMASDTEEIEDELNMRFR